MNIQKILLNNKRIIGMWGYPDPEIFKQVIAQYPEHQVIDFDINFDAPDFAVLPDAYCQIIKNLVNNALALKDRIDVIIAAVGEEKCDAGRFAAQILSDLGLNVIQSKYTKFGDDKIQTPISMSNLPLKTKVINIMDSIIQPVELNITESKPTLGFWGVPPNDIKMLELFPNTTHVYGWIRCVEAKRPADLDLEMYVDETVPTVFFSQTFCAKMQLAKYLAKKHNGLFVDVDDTASNSVKAKIQAFIRLG